MAGKQAPEHSRARTRPREGPGHGSGGRPHESQGYEGTRAEVWFETEERAQAAGFKPWHWRGTEN